MLEVLTDVPGKPGHFWGDHTTFVGPAGPPPWLRSVLGKRWAERVARSVAGVRMLARRHRCQGVVTNGGPSGAIFAWFQTLVPFGRKPHVVVDFNLHLAKTRLGFWFKKLQIHLATRSVHRFVVWASHEVDDYATIYGVPREKLEYVPHHTTLNGYQYDVRDDGYLFAGGNFDRDYANLVEAVREMDLPVRIATTRPELLAWVDVPAHVKVQGTTDAGFRQAMAASKLTVVPMAAATLHSGGQQTALNSMFMGKPTIAVGRRWAVDLIRDGEDGLIVDYADPVGLRRAIRWVLDHPEAARRMGERAHETAARFTTQRTMQAVYEIVTGQRVGQDGSPPSRIQETSDGRIAAPTV